MKVIKLVSANSPLEFDRLFQIFDRYLKDLTRPHQTQDELIFDVVAEYMLHLMNIGNVPFPEMDKIELDLTEEVREIYRKKTYGYNSLQDYRNQIVKKCC